MFNSPSDMNEKEASASKSGEQSIASRGIKIKLRLCLHTRSNSDMTRLISSKVELELVARKYVSHDGNVRARK